MFYLSSRVAFAQKLRKTQTFFSPLFTLFSFCMFHMKHRRKFVYFFTICVVFSLARIAFPKRFEVKHTIYFEQPYMTMFFHFLQFIARNVSVIHALIAIGFQLFLFYDFFDLTWILTTIVFFFVQASVQLVRHVRKICRHIWPNQGHVTLTQGTMRALGDLLAFLMTMNVFHVFHERISPLANESRHPWHVSGELITNRCQHDV